MPNFVYVLYSKKLDKYYTGQTDDLEARIGSHKSGKSPYTSNSDDWILVYSEEYNTREEAIKRELAIKKKKSRKYIEWLISNKREL